MIVQCPLCLLAALSLSLLGIMESRSDGVSLLLLGPIVSSLFFFLSSKFFFLSSFSAGCESQMPRPTSCPFVLLLLLVLFLHLAVCLLYPPIRVTPKPPPTSPDHHGPYAQPEPADGFQFVGIGREQREQQQVVVVEPVEQNRHKKRGYRSCTFKYIPHSCNETSLCESQRLCVQITGDPCCAPNEGECPTPAQLGVTCLKNKPVNWCHHSQDCARSALCCDTGCGYNMCVERQQI